MRGHIVKRYENSYSIVLNLGKDPATGKRKQQWMAVKGSRKDAEKRLSEMLHQLDTGTFMKPSAIKLGEYLEQWLRDYCKPNLSPRTTETYDYIVHTHLIPALGQIPLTELKPQHLTRFYADKLLSGRVDGKGGLSNRSVQYCHVTIHKALDIALKSGMISRNVADAVDHPKVKRHEMQTMNETDIHLFLEMARSTPYYALFYVAIFTGMRRSEILALRWSDVDLLLCQISVNRTIHQIHNGLVVYGAPKTDKSRRTIALTPSTCEVLIEHRETQEKFRESVGLKALTDDNLIFCTIDDKPYTPNSISHAWKNLSRRCGLKEIHFHSARHTHASLLLKQGIHPKVVQERLGHSSIQITLDTYSHVAPGLQQAAANRFDDILLPREKEKIR
jgi:integrase